MLFCVCVCVSVSVCKRLGKKKKKKTARVVGQLADFHSFPCVCACVFVCVFCTKHYPQLSGSQDSACVVSPIPSHRLTHALQSHVWMYVCVCLRVWVGVCVCVLTNLLTV